MRNKKNGDTVSPKLENSLRINTAKDPLSARKAKMDEFKSEK